MAVAHPVDTSVLKRLSVQSVRSVVQALADAGRLGRAGISDLEVGYSARNTRGWDWLFGALEVLPLVESPSLHVTRTQQGRRSLSSPSQRGRNIPGPMIAPASA